VGRLADVILAAGADVVGLNEVLHPVIVDHRTHEPLAQLAHRLGMYYAFGPSGWVDRGPAWQGPQGNAVLSRYPLTDVSNRWLPRVPGTKQRSLLGATLAGGPAQGLVAFVTHLDHAFEGTRLLQLNGILSQLARHGPHFLGQHSRRLLPPVLRWLQQAGYQDAFRTVGQGGGRTFPAHAPLFRLDFLFFPRHWAGGLRSARTLDCDAVQQASDHRPLVVEWAWPEVVAPSPGPV
jgi:endonuclease/exonuclease/phosphatase family metal-dependent hydrolase